MWTDAAGLPAELPPQFKDNWMNQMIFDMAVVFGINDNTREFFGPHWSAILEDMHDKFLAGLLMPKPGTETDRFVCSLNSLANGGPLFPQEDPKKRAALKLLEGLE